MRRKVVFVPRTTRAWTPVAFCEPDGTEIDRPAGVGSLLVYDSEEAARRDYPNAPLQKVYLEPPEPEHLRA